MPPPVATGARARWGEPDAAETIAAETGATVAVLDPLEGLTDESAGDDYVSVMRSNLKTLVKGQSCS